MLTSRGSAGQDRPGKCRENRGLGQSRSLGEICKHTHRPWSIVASVEFPDERAAAHFERYLKSGSGRAFAKRHFAPVE